MPKGLKGNKKTKNKSKDKMYKRLGIWVKKQTKTIDILGTKYIVKFQYGKFAIQSPKVFEVFKKLGIL